MRRILTVDDSSSVRQMVSFTLRKAGYEVVEAVDGKDGLGKVGAAKFDLIVTDLNITASNGWNPDDHRGPHAAGILVRSHPHAHHRISSREKRCRPKSRRHGLDRQTF